MTVEIDTPAEPVKKPPRKPRPSELRAKAAKAEAAKKAAKPKAKKAVKRKPTKKAAKAVKAKAPARKLVRTARLDLRCTPSERALAIGVAKRKGVTVTDLVMDVLKRYKPAKSK